MLDGANSTVSTWTPVGENSLKILIIFHLKFTVEDDVMIICCFNKWLDLPWLKKEVATVFIHSILWVKICGTKKWTQKFGEQQRWFFLFEVSLHFAQNKSWNELSLLGLWRLWLNILPKLWQIKIAKFQMNSFWNNALSTIGTPQPMKKLVLNQTVPSKIKSF